MLAAYIQYDKYKNKKCTLRNPTPKGCTLTLWCIISTELYSQNVVSLYPVQNFISKCPQPCAQRIHRNLPTDMSTYVFPNCWQNISNTNIYFVIFIFVFRFEEYMSVVFIYIGIVYIIPTIEGNVSIRGFLCAQECTFGNIYICIGYMLPTFGEYTSVGGFLCALRAQS